MSYKSMIAVLRDLDGFHTIEAGYGNSYAVIYRIEWTGDEDCPRVQVEYRVPDRIMKELSRRNFLTCVRDDGNGTTWDISELGKLWRLGYRWMRAHRKFENALNG